MSDIIEFGLDDAGVIQNAAIEAWKQRRQGEISRVSIISFKTVADCFLAQKMKEGKTFSDEEKRDLHKKIDLKIAESLKKDVSQLTQADRLELKQPRLGMARTHYKDGVGTVRCLSKWEGQTLVKPELCCERLGDVEQAAAAVIVSYPVDQEGQIDEDLLLQRKYTTFHIWKMSAKKYKVFESAYKDARKDNRFVIDLKVTLDQGDIKYQKQIIVPSGNATWAQENMTKAGIRDWVLDQGIRCWKYVNDNLGYSMSRDRLAEKLAQGGASPNQLGSGSSGSSNNAPAPALTAVNYDDLAG